MRLTKPGGPVVLASDPKTFIGHLNANFILKNTESFSLGAYTSPRRGWLNIFYKNRRLTFSEWFAKKSPYSPSVFRGEDHSDVFG